MAVRALVVGVVCAAGAYAAVISLTPDGAQVNNEPPNGIDPHQDAGVSDVAGGSLVPGGPRVPWGTFEQRSGNHDKIFEGAQSKQTRRTPRRRWQRSPRQLLRAYCGA